jgi:hypothetical protein
MALGVGSHVSATAAAATSVTTASRSITAGSLIVVGVLVYSSSGSNIDGATPVTDSVGNTYTKVGNTSLATDGHRYAELFYAKNVTGGASVTFTYTITASDYPRIFVLEVTGADTATPLDVHNESDGSGVISVTTSSITTGTANEILVASGGDADAGSQLENWSDGGCTNNSGTWTRDESITDNSTLEGSIAHAIVASTGSYCVTQTGAGGYWRSACIASFKQAGGCGGNLARDAAQSTCRHAWEVIARCPLREGVTR